MPAVTAVPRSFLKAVEQSDWLSRVMAVSGIAAPGTMCSFLLETTFPAAFAPRTAMFMLALASALDSCPQFTHTNVD